MGLYLLLFGELAFFRHVHVNLKLLLHVLLDERQAAGCMTH
jgi:hypothetical protein